MAARTRFGISALSLAAIAVIALLVVRGATGAAGAPAASDGRCGSATAATTLSAALDVALRIRDEEAAGPTVSRARRTISSDRTLARAIAAGDARAARRAALVVLFDGEHIVRLRVVDRAGRVLAAVGSRLVLSPLFATLSAGGRRVGSVEFSVQDDEGYRLLTDRLDGALTVMRHDGQTVMSDVAVGSRRLRQRGTVRIGGTIYLVATIVTGRFPSGHLRISLLVRRPAAALAPSSCAQVRADALAGVTRRVYREYRDGPEVAVGRYAVDTSTALAPAMTADDRSAARRAAAAVLRAGHLVRVRVLVGGSVLADVGDPRPVVAPITVPVYGRSHRRVGSVQFAAQSANGLVGVSSYLIEGDVLVRVGSRQLAGRVSGPATVPASGLVRYRGSYYSVASFDGERFPSGRVRIYVLAPDR